MIRKYIGTSLSFCVQDILMGNVQVDEISAIVTSTRFDDCQDAIDYYFTSYWSEYADYDTCKETLQAIWHIVFQPRKVDIDSRGHYAGQGFWLNTETGEYSKHLNK